MRRRTKVIISVVSGVVVLGVAAAIVVPIVYANNENGHAAAAPTIAPTGNSTLAASAADGKWTAGGDTFAGYRVHEVLNGNDVEVTGRTKSVTGDVTVANESITAGTLTVKVADIATDSSSRDSYFRSSALDTSSFPNATFTVDSGVDIGAALSGKDKSVTLPGTLTLHGVSKHVNVAAEVGVDKDKTIQVTGSIPITFQDYGVTAPSLGFVKVDAKGAVEFSLDLTK